MRKIFEFICIIFLIFSFIFVGFSKSADFDLVPSLIQSNSKYFVVEFSDLIYQEDKDELRNVGVEVINYIGNNSFLTKFDKGLINEVSEFSFVSSVQRYKKPKLKSLSVMSLKNVESKNVDKKMFIVGVFDSNVLDSLKNEIKKLDGEILDETSNRVIILIDSSVVYSLNEFEEIDFITPYKFLTYMNENSKSSLNVNYYFENYGLYGEGQTVAVADTGLDIGIVSSLLHKDFLNKSVAFLNYVLPGITDDGPSDLESGHGTHVAGSIVGTGVLSGANLSSNNFSESYSGTAPKADLYFQAMEILCDSLPICGGAYNKFVLITPTDLNDMFQSAYNYGARIQSNSWGDSTNLGDYTQQSVDVDTFMWNNKDYTILFAAGNNGTYGAGSILPPGTSKNTITVGASVGDSSIASFSSRGPTDDLRIKPDVVAPGSNIISTRSHVATGILWGHVSVDYENSGGTSMATPLTAGIVTLVREYLNKNKNITNPSSALIKAMIINGARNITGVVPNMNEGWGFVDLNNSIYEDEYRKNILIENDVGLLTSETYQYKFEVSDSSKTLKITTVWTDYPGTSTGSGTELVNDLDIVLISPDGTKYFGNDFISPFNDVKDNLNNVEGIKILNPIRGEYTLNVSGFSVPIGPQPFSFVISKTDFINPVIQNITPVFDDIVYSDNLSFELNINFTKNITFLNYFDGLINMNLSDYIINNNSVNMSLNVSNFGKQNIIFNFTDYQNISSSYILNFTLIENFKYNLSYPLNNSKLNLSKLAFFMNLSFNKNISSLVYKIENYTFNITNLIDNTKDLKISNNLDIIEYGLFNISFFYIDVDNIYGNFTVTLNLTSKLGKNLTDFDEDGINNSVDKLIGNSSNVNSNYNNLNITVNSSANLSQLFSDSLEIVIANVSDKIIEFNNNFSNNSVDLSKIVVKREVDNSNKSKFFVKGIDLEIGKTKTIYFKLNGNVSKSNSLCLKDTEIFSFEDISLFCDGSNETFIDSVPKVINGYNLSYLDEKTIKITGLKHSGVSQMCTEDWSYNSWSSCSSGSQSRTAVDLNLCGTIYTQENLTQSCIVPSSGSGGSSSSGSSSGGGGGGGYVKKNTLIKDDKNLFSFKVGENNVSSNSEFSKLETVEIFEDEFKLVSFYFDFKSIDLDLSSIDIKYEFNGQSSVVLSGFSELNLIKTVYLKNNLNLNYVCVKNDEILSIDEISKNCLEDNEVLLKCDGVSISGLSCSLIEGYYQVYGLTKTAVLEVNSEMIPNKLFNDDFELKNVSIGKNIIIDNNNQKIINNDNNNSFNDEYVDSNLNLSEESTFEKYLLVFLFLISFILIAKIFIFKHKVKKNKSN